MSKNMTVIIPTNYQGQAISFNEDGWFNATEAAARFGKRPAEWLRLPSTEDYIEALVEVLITSQNGNCQESLASLATNHKVGLSHFVKTKRGTKSPGTWFHPRLAIPFARWLDARFAIWCDLQIDQIIRGTHPRFDWKKMRAAAASSFNVMTEALRIVREAQGKQTAAHHYINETRLVNFVLCGQFAALDREALSDIELDLLAKLEIRNAVLVAQGFDYPTRKASLLVFAKENVLALPAESEEHQPALVC